MKKNEVAIAEVVAEATVAEVVAEAVVAETKIPEGAFGGRIVAVDADGLDSGRTNLHYKAAHLVIDASGVKRTPKEAYMAAMNGESTMFDMLIFSMNEHYHKAVKAMVGELLIANGFGVKSIVNGNSRTQWELKSFDIIPANAIENPLFRMPTIVDESSEEEDLDF